MRIGLFTDTYYPQINGVATSTMILAKELRKLGHKVFIFTTSDPDARDTSPYVFRLPSLPFVFLTSHRMTLLYPPKLLVKFKKFKLDVIHTQTEFSIGILGKLASVYLKIPLVHTYHTMYEDYVHYILNGNLVTPKMARRYSRLFCNSARAVIAPVQKAKDSLVSYGVKKPITIIPTGIDFWPFSREKYTPGEIKTLKSEIGLNQTDPVVLVLGRIAQEKSMDVIIKAMPKLLDVLPSAKLVVVGDGPKKEELMELAVKLKVAKSTIFTGARPWSEIGKYYHLGDVFVSASTSETQGLTFVEAIAAKVPVVAKKDPSLEGVITDGQTGFYFEKDSQLPGILHKVLTDPDRNKELIERAYDSIQSLSSAAFGKTMETLYKGVLKIHP